MVAYMKIKMQPYADSYNIAFTLINVLVSTIILGYIFVEERIRLAKRNGKKSKTWIRNYEISI